MARSYRLSDEELIDVLRDEYFKNNLTLSEISKKYHTYPMKLSRLAKKFGIKLYTQKKATSKKLKGKPKTLDQRKKISKTLSQNADSEEMSRRSKIAWCSSNRAKMKEIGKQARAKSLREINQPSKFKRLIIDYFKQQDYQVLLNYEIDSEIRAHIYLPQEKLCLLFEMPIELKKHGTLSKVTQEYMEKYGYNLLTKYGYKVIIMKNYVKIPLYKQYKILDLLSMVIKYCQYGNIDTINCEELEND